MNWESLTYKQKSDLMRIYLQNGISSLDAMKEHYNSFQNGGLKPKFNQSSEQYYDKDNDIIHAPDTVGEGYQHEYFHARPDTTLLKNLRPYYENLNDQRLLQLGADLPFIKRLNNDPNHFYNPEEIGARVTAARYMLEKAGVKNIDAEFLKNARLNELKYGDNFRDLLHMYNDENLLNIFNGQYQKGGSLGHITNLGQWKYPGEVTTIPSNNITMKGVDYPVIGVSNTGDIKYMLPNLNYKFDGSYVTEYPVHKFQYGGPNNPPSWHKPLTVAGTTQETSDNTYVSLPISQIELAKMKSELETKQIQDAMVKASRNQPQLKADNRTSSDKKHESQRREEQVKLDATRAAQRDFISLGRPNTESTQAAVMTTPYTTEAASNYLRNDNIVRDLGYFIPGISNVLMAQDANQQTNNGQYGWAVLSGLGALSPVVGLTPNFKSQARYTKPANQVGDWTILDYERAESPRVTIQPELNSIPTLQLSPTESVKVTPTRVTSVVPQLTYNSTRGVPKASNATTPSQINLPERFVNFVDNNGNIDINRFSDFWQYVSKQYGNNNVDIQRILHSIKVAQTAQQLPLPKGVSRKDYVQAALLHDIGTAVEGHTKTHGPAGAKIMRKIAGTQLTTEQYEAIEKHMDNTSYGKERNLLKAVEAADAANSYSSDKMNISRRRGKSLAEVLALNPNVMNYSYEPTFNYTGRKAAENFRDDLKTKVNPILKQTGLGTIPLDSSVEEASKLLNDKTTQWRTLIRGARDPMGTSLNSLMESRNVANAEKLAKQYFGEDKFNSNPEYYRALISTQTIPLDPTGSGRAGFANVVKKDDGLFYHTPSEASKFMDIDLDLYDALYLSNSSSVGTGYKTGTGTDFGREGVSRLVYIPFEQYGGETLPSEWMLNNFDWDLLSANPKQFASGKKTYGLTRFSQFDIPYRLQTGRSFMSDYGNTISRKVEKQKSIHTPVESPYYYKEQMNQIRTINSMLDKYGFNNISPFNEDGSIIYRGRENEELYNIMKLINTFPEQSFEELDKGNIYVRPEPTWGGTRALVGTEASDYKQRLLRFFYNSGMLSDAQYKKRKYINIDRKYLIKKALDKYYTKNKTYKPTKEFLDQSKMMEFMLQQNVEPRVLNPNYLSTLAINTGGKPLPEGSPLFFNPNRGSNQLSIIAPKGTKVVEDLGDASLDVLFNGIMVGKRHDFGHRSLGVTTKFNNGGKLNGRQTR